MESTRLPGKVLMELNGTPVLLHIYNELKKCKMVDDIIIATSNHSEDDKIEDFCKSHGIKYYRGSHKNVLERFYKCASMNNSDLIIRLTGDNALIDSSIVDDGINHFLSKNNDYECYCDELPLGVSIEIFSYSALKKAYLEADDAECLEHVTPYFYRNPNTFHCENVSTNKYDAIIAYMQKMYGISPENLRWTMDTPKDYELVSNIYKELENEKNKSFTKIIELYKYHPEWININSSVEQIKVNYIGN